VNDKRVLLLRVSHRTRPQAGTTFSTLTSWHIWARWSITCSALQANTNSP